jgi:hypothetical protein
MIPAGIPEKGKEIPVHNDFYTNSFQIKKFKFSFAI